MPLKNNSTQYDSIDLLKFIGSILVFTLHLQLYGKTDINFAIQLVSRWCVPFFFITSSFFLFKKAENGVLSSQRLAGYVKRILLLYLSWMVINIPSIIYTRFMVDPFSLKTYAHFIKNIILSSSYKGSWYLLSSVFSAVLIYLLSKKLSNKAILLCTLPLYLICAATSVYGNLLPYPVFHALEFLCFPINIFSGCFYFALGKCLAEKENKLAKISKSRAVWLTVFAYTLFCGEVIFAKAMNLLKSTDAALLTAAAGMAFAVLGLKLDIKIKNSLALRKMSTIIYCAQGNILLLGVIIKQILPVKSYLLYYIIMCLIMTFTVLIVLTLQKKVKWRALSYLT